VLCLSATRFESQGFTVLHFDDDYVYKHLPDAMETIKAALEERY
jgi:very-short-patch-repair endonuclease